MPLLETFRQKEVSNLSHGLSSTLSPLAPPFTVNRNAVNQSPNSSQLVEPSFRDYSSPLSGSLDNWLHLHPPASAPDGWHPIDVDAGLGSSNFPASAARRVPNSFSYPSGAYEYAGLPVNMELGEKRTVADENYSTQLVLGVHEAVGSGFGSSASSSLPEYFQCPSEYGIYYSGVVPGGSSQSGGYSTSASKYQPSNKWENFQGGELGKEKQMNDVVRTGEQHFLPKIKTCRSNSRCAREEELSLHPPGSSVNGDLSIIHQRKYSDTFGRHNQGDAEVADLKCLVTNQSAAISRRNGHLPFVGISGASASSPCMTLHDYELPSSDVLPATSAWAFTNSDSVSTNRYFIQHSSCMTDSTVVYPGATCYPLVQALQPISTGNHLLNETVVSENVNYSSCLPEDQFENPKDFAGYIFSTGKGTESDLSIEDNLVHNFKGNNEGSNNSNTIYPQGTEDSFSSYQGAFDCLSDKRSFGNSELTASSFNVSASAVCEQVLDVSTATGKTFHEKNDQFISVVDSPCWKGVPAFRCSPFEAALSSHCFKNFELSDESLPVHDGTVSFLETSNQLIWSHNECIDGASPPAVHMTAASLSLQTKSADTYDTNLAPSKNCSGDVFEGIQKIKEQSSSSTSDQERHELKIPSRVSLANEKSNVISRDESIMSEATVKDCSTCNRGPIQDGLSDLLSQPVGQIQNSFCPGTSISTAVPEKLHGLSDNSSEYLPERTDIHILLKAMHNLSTLLLSRCYADQNALKEHDLEVLQLVINNLDECFVKKSSHLSEPCRPIENCFVDKHRADPCKVTGLCGSRGISAELINDVGQTGKKGTGESRRSIHMNGTPKNIGSHKFASFISGLHFEKVNVRQAMEKLLNDDLNPASDDLPQIQVYKTLWLEAEAALCAMKYEVILARVKAKIAEAEQYQDLTGSSNVRLNSDSGGMSSLNGSHDAMDSDNQNLHAVKSSASERNDLESSVYSRYKVLRQRIEGSNKQEEGQPVPPDSIDNEDIDSKRHVEKPVQMKVEIDSHKSSRGKVAPGPVPAISTHNSNQEFDAADVINQIPLEFKGLISKHSDVEASVAARIKILKERSEKFGMLEEGPVILPDSIDDEGIDCNRQMEAAIMQEPTSGSKAPKMYESFSNVNIGFTEQSWQPFVGASLQNTRVHFPCDELGRSYPESRGTYAPLTTFNARDMNLVPWQVLDTSKTFHSQANNGFVSLMHPSPPDGVSTLKREPVKGSDKISANGATSSSHTDCTYDWEHVLKEEIAC